jgi:hypothetical protein
MYVYRLLRPRHDSWNPGARRPHERRMIAKSTQLIGTIVGTEVIVDFVVSNSQSRKRRGISDVLMTLRSGVRFTAPRGMI